jgi:hypothetical protein
MKDDNNSRLGGSLFFGSRAMCRRFAILFALLAALPTAGAEPDLSKARVEGVVVDESGKPVAGVHILVTRWRPPVISGDTNADGKFRLVFPQGSVRYQTLIASTDGGKRQGLIEISDTANDLVTNVRIVLKPARAITVRVVNDMNDPVIGASVGLFEHLTPFVIGDTDRQGSIDFQYPVDMKLTQIAALKPGVGFDYFENYRSARGSIPLTPPKQVTLTLNGARKVKLRAEDSAGKPLANIEFIPWTIQKKGRLFYCNLSGAAALRGACAKSDANGIAAFDWLPFDMVGGTTLLCRSEQYHEPSSVNFDPADANKPLVTRLLRLATMSGKLTLPDGKPAGGIVLQIEGRGETNHYFRGVVRTRSDGTWSLPVYPNQTYVVAVTNENWAATSRANIVAKEDEKIAGLDFKLGKGTLVHGRVTVGKDKMPAGNQTITLIENQTLVRWAKTDKNGEYQVRVGDGAYEIRFEQKPEAIAVNRVSSIVRNYHLDRLPRGELRGLVKLADGKPAANAHVIGEPVGAPGHAGMEGLTDSQGRYVLDRWRDKMHLYARDENGVQAAIIAIDEDTEKADLTLAPAATAMGQLVDRAGLPVAGAIVQCNLTVKQGKAVLRIQIQTTTDAAGQFQLGGLIDGSECAISAYARDHFQAIKSFKATAGNVENLRVVKFRK